MRFCAKAGESFSKSTVDIGKEESHVKTIDHYSFRCGVIDCFNEMVSAGVKRIAFSEPMNSAEECRSYRPFVEKTCHKYGTRFYFEPSSLVTDLFPKELNAGRAHYIFYREEDALREYLAVRAEKEELAAVGAYRGEQRRALAYRFGRLLSYTDEAIARRLAENKSREPDT